MISILLLQFTEEKLGQAEKTELDTHFEKLLSRADCTKNWTEKIYRQTEVVLQPNPGEQVLVTQTHLIYIRVTGQFSGCEPFHLEYISDEGFDQTSSTVFDENDIQVFLEKISEL